MIRLRLQTFGQANHVIGKANYVSSAALVETFNNLMCNDISIDITSKTNETSKLCMNFSHLAGNSC